VPGSSASATCAQVSCLLQPSVFAIVSFHTFAKTTAPSPLRQNHAVRPSASRKHLVTVLGELLADLGVDGCALLGVDELLLESTLALVVGRALDLSPLLEPKRWSVSKPSLSINAVSKTYLSTTSLYFQPNSRPRRPTEQYLRPGLRRRTRRAWGTTMRFLWS
jgi:hypothetical protein